MENYFGPKVFLDINFFNLHSLDKNLKLLGLKFFGHGLLLDQKMFEPETTTVRTTTTAILMGFDTIKFNLVWD